MKPKNLPEIETDALSQRRSESANSFFCYKKLRRNFRRKKNILHSE